MFVRIAAVDDADTVDVEVVSVEGAAPDVRAFWRESANLWL